MLTRSPDTGGSRITVEAVVREHYREHYGKMLASLIYQFEDIQLAEDCLQDAITVALSSWKIDDLPMNLTGWIIRTAQRKAIDRYRRDTNFQAKQRILSVSSTSHYKVHNQIHNKMYNTIDENDYIPDERLRLIFTCCHPALSESARIALTLKLLSGLTTLQIANAYLTREKTMAQRLVRAKHKIKQAGIGYEIPEPSQFKQRLASVLSVLYLIFNEAYYSSSTEKLLQVDLCQEAMRLTKTVYQLMPDESEAMGLLALMYFHYARFPARFNESGEMVGLRQQNRTLWLNESIVAGDKLLKAALMKAKLGAYQVQAAISAIHTHADSHEQTDWQQILLLYQKLYVYQPSPVVELNAAVALSFAYDVDAGLRAIETLENKKLLDNYQPLFAAKADLLRRTGKIEEAKCYYQKAIKLSGNRAEKEFLQSTLLDLG